jgi:hypothetical protein
VLDWGSEVTLVEVFDTHSFSTQRLRRPSQYRRAKVAGDPRRGFPSRAAAFNEVLPSRPKVAKLRSKKESAASAGASFKLITIQRECIQKDVCYIGKLIRVSQRAITIQPITPQAEWEGQERYQLKDITLLGFGGVYEHLLGALAKPISTVLP